MRERALYAMTFGLGAVTAGLIAYAAWRVLPPEAAPQAVAVAAQEPRATEPRNERDSAMRNAEERAQLALAPSSLLGEDVAKRGGDESRPDGVGEQSVAAAPVSPAPIGGPFVAPDFADMAAPASERAPVPAPEANASPEIGAQAGEQARSPAPQPQSAAEPEAHVGHKRTERASGAAESPAAEKQAALAEGARPKAQPAARAAARRSASKKPSSAAKANSRRAPPRRMRGRLPVRVWRGEPPEHLYVYDPMIPPGSRLIVVEPD